MRVYEDLAAAEGVALNISLGKYRRLLLLRPFINRMVGGSEDVGRDGLIGLRGRHG